MVCSKSRERLGLLLTHSFFTVCPSWPLLPLPESQKVFSSFVWLDKDITCDSTELLRIRDPGGPVPRLHGHSEEPLAECCGQKFNIPRVFLVKVTFHCRPWVPAVRPVAQVAHGGPLFCASEKDAFCHKDSDAVNSSNTKSSIFKRRVQESHTDSMRTLSVLPRLPRRLNVMFI